MAITDYAIIPKADYKAVCDKIREHSGKTDVIKSGDLATEIEAIAGSGGGSVAGVHYVTFIYPDAKEPYVRPVADGDDCADIVARGLISTPTKESTVSQTFTYSGWSLTDGGAASSDALKAVTEDRTVYAAFTATARKYAARFYDDSGVLMQESQVAYGTKATPPDTFKDGYAFVAWTPSDFTIYGDTDFVGEWEKLSGFAFKGSLTHDLGIYDAISNPDGTHLAIGSYPNATSPAIYDISGTPTLLDGLPTLNSGSYQYWDYSHDGSRLISYHKYGSSGTRYTILDYANGQYSATTVSGGSTSTSNNYVRFYATDRIVNAAGTSITLRNVSKEYYTSYFPSLGTASTGITNGSLCVSQDGTTAAVGQYGREGANEPAVIYVYDISNDKLTLKHTINRENYDGPRTQCALSLNANGTKLALCHYKAGGDVTTYVTIYDLTTPTPTEICNISEYFSNGPYAAFVNGTDMLVVGSGSTVKVFDISSNTLQEIDTYPTYGGTSITGIRSNHTGTRITIWGGNYCEIWAKY